MTAKIPGLPWVVLGVWALPSMGCSDDGVDPIQVADSRVEVEAAGSGGTGGTVVGTGGAQTGGAAGAAGAEEIPDACGEGGCTGGLLPSTGYIEQYDSCGIVGAWYTFGGEGAQFEPRAGEQVAASGGKICFRGTAPQVINGDFETYYGAAVGFDVCGMPDDPSWLPAPMNSFEANSKHTAGECGISLNHISFTITGTLNAELRVVFKEPTRDERYNAYLEVSGTGYFCGAVSDTFVRYDIDQPPTNPENVESIHFQVATHEMSDIDWDFCISDLTIN